MGQYFDLQNTNIKAIADLVRQRVPAVTDAEVEAFIDADWPNVYEHQDWLYAATDEEVAQWVCAVLVNTHPSMIPG